MEKKLYELTSPQKAIYLTEQFYNGTSIGNVGGTSLFKDKVNFTLFEKALNIFVQKNDAMRIKIFMDKGIPKQYIEEYSFFDVDLVEIKNNEELKELEEKIFLTPFNLFNSFLFKFVMIRFPDGTGGWNANFHHTICDAWSIKLIEDQVIDIYIKLINSQEVSMIPEYSYVEYINREKEYLNSNLFIKDKEYWSKKFDILPELTSLRTVNSKSSLTAKREPFKLGLELTNRIKEFCSTNKIFPFTLFVAIYSFYLSRVTSLDDVIVGVPILNRTNFKEKNTFGMFVSTMPFKVSVNQSISFLDYLTNLSKEQLTLLRHQKYHYDYIIEDMRKEHNISNGLYDIIISYQNARNNSRTADLEYSSDWIFNGNISESLDIHIYDMDDTGEFTIYYDYLVEIFTRKDMIDLHERILHILSQILKNSEMKLQDVDIVTPQEKHKILYEFNDTKREYSKEPIHVLVEKQAKETPERVAVVFEDTSLTYRELNEKSNSLAYLLRERGIKQNDIVGLMVNRSLEMIVGILAILKAGGAYTPIDPEYPEERIQYMLENSNAAVLLSQKKLQGKLDFKNIINIDLSEDFYNKHTEDIKNIIKPEDRIFLIYTSGSTGEPKGVMLTHKAISNLTNYCNHYIEYLSDDKYRAIVSVTTVSFDIFIFETLISLQKGLKLVIANEDEQVIPQLLNNLIKKNQVEIIQTTPSRMQLLINGTGNMPDIANLKYITLAGEQYPISLANELKKISNNVRLYNGYGPSETTVFSTLTNVTGFQEMTIGKPLDNTQIYILKENNLCPINVPGEIYISGDGVGLGYINNEELTKKSFVRDIFNENQIMYKSGDLGYYREDGQIVCLGRIDHQVKIRGLRIELGEIEQKISEFPSILNCIVDKKELGSHELLCAYYVANSNIDIFELRHHLLKYLPAYMVPQYFVVLEQLPYTPNGKIDRKKLPMPTLETRSKKKKLPRNELDAKLLVIFEDSLEAKNISINDSILDLGGDSLTIINICTKIQANLSLSIKVKEILELQTVEKISDFLKDKKTIVKNVITKTKKQDYYPISEQQKGVYIATKKAGHSSCVYNIPISILLNGKVDVSRFEQVINTIIRRHEAFRTSFIVKDENIVQKVCDNISIKVEVLSIEEAKNFVKPFSLEEAPLLRVAIVKLEKRSIILLDIHHIICDGKSLQILLQEIETLYNGGNLSTLELRYIDYAVWQEKNKSTKREILYEPLDIYYDYSRKDVETYNGDTLVTSIAQDKTKTIQSLIKGFNATPYIFFLTAYFIFLSRYSLANTITVASAIESRPDIDLENVIGMFVKNLIIKSTIDNTYSFKEIINKLNKIVIEEIEESNQCTDSYSTYKIFDTMFLYINNIGEKITLGDNHGTGEPIFSNTSKCDFSLQVRQNIENYNLEFEYCTDLLEKETANCMLKNYINILNQVIENPNIKLSDIETVSLEEKHKLLYEFNNTEVDYLKEKTISQLFEEQAEKTPNKIAVICDNKQLTYKELNEKANSLAHYLRGKYIKNNDIVGIMVERSLEMVVRHISHNKSRWYIFTNRTIISRK